MELTAIERADAVAKRKALKGMPCTYCGVTGVTMHIDHAIPIFRGGTDRAGNLVQSCAACNLRKHTLTAGEFRALLNAELDSSAHVDPLR